MPTLPTNEDLLSFKSPNPLNVLEQSGYNVANFTYPIDLTNDPSENHMVVFYINESQNTQYATRGNNGELTVVPGNLSATGTSSPTPNGAVPTINNPYNESTGQGNATNFSKRPINRVSSVITLYIPPAISTNYSTKWDTIELGATGNILQDAMSGNTSLQQLLKEVGVGVIAGAAQDATAWAQNKLGANFDVEGGISYMARAIRNPHLEMIFRGVGFRQFQFDFVFTPRSEQEAVHVANIIKAFKFYSAAEIKHDSASPKYFIYPAEFDIEFWSNGQPNTFINKISTCACDSVQVNYTGSGGWSSFRNGSLNGMSVETHLSLHFQELEIMTKERILQGF